ncbi:MAG: extracellular solute-binding protein, partial [Bdellovibrionales bacterium]
SSITIHINPNARFNDGSHITAEDILFTYETLKTQGRPNMRHVYKLINKAEKIDNLTLKFTFGDGYDQETAMIMAMMPVLSKNYWKDRTFDSATLEPPVSSGPYRIKTVDVGKQVIFERDENYWAKDLFVNVGHHNFDTVIYNYYRDDTVALESFLKGDIDIRRETDTAKWSTLYNDSPNITKQAFKHGRPVKIESLIFNTRRPPFDDINVRKALNLAFDGDWINKNIYYGEKKRITSFFENSELATPKSNDTWTPAPSNNIRKNLKDAANLLSNAGWETTDGQLVHKETKQPFSFEILVQKSEHEKIALNFINHLKRLGIEGNIRRLDSAAFRDRLNKYDYDMVAYHWISSLSPGTEQHQYWSCEASKQEMRWNFAGICDEKIDALVTKIPQATTRKEIKELIQDLDKQLLNHVSTIPLFYTPTDNFLYQKTISHPKTSPLYGPVLETWWMNEQ